MSRKERSSKKISTAPHNEFGSNPFASLDGQGLPEALPEPEREIKVSVKEEESNLGKGVRLEIRREKSGRGGKTVTTVRGIPPGLGKEKKDKLLKRIKSSLGTKITATKILKMFLQVKFPTTMYWLEVFHARTIQLQNL